MKMSTDRLEAFSDGVMSILITIMAFNIPLPKDFSNEGLREFSAAIAVFFVSFVVVGTQWIRHHFLFSLCKEVSSMVLWRNIFYLFFLSLMPLFTKWIMENPGEVLPAIGYNVVFLMVAICFQMMKSSLFKESKEKFPKELMRRRKEQKYAWVFFIVVSVGMVSIFVLSFFYPTLSIIFFVGLPVVSSIINLWIER